MKKLSLLMIFFIVFSCKTSYHYFEEAKIKKEVFNDIKIKDISLILNFFENTICDLDEATAKGIQICYRDFLNNISKKPLINIPLEEQYFVLRKLTKETTKQIWYFDSEGQGRSEVILLKKIHTEGEYFKFIKYLSKDYPQLNIYMKFLSENQNNTKSAYSFFTQFFDEKELTDSRIKLIIAIHFLTLNELEKI